jgi:hypothetical protein
VSESPLRAGLLAVGTDDGLVQITRDDGGSWEQAILPDMVPEMTYVSRVRWSSHDEGTLYATFEAHKDNDFQPYVIKSTDYGAGWTDISSDLPEFGPVRVIVEHPRNPDLLFVGTESSVFVSFSGGANWLPLGNNLPTVPVHDMVIHPRENDLVLGTHGRGFWVLDDITILEEMTAEVASSGVHLAGPRTARQLSFNNRGRSSLGHSRFASRNPPSGVMIDYWVGPSASATGGEEAGALAIEILDRGGDVVRRLDPPAGATRPGIHRLVWDMRYAPALLPNLEGGFDRGSRAPWVLPGDYQVRLRRGTQEQVREVRIVGDPAVDISAADRASWHDTQVLLYEMIEVSHAVVTTARQLEGQLAQVRELLGMRPDAAEVLGERVDDIQAKLQGILDEMQGADSGGGATQPGAPPLASQIRQIYSALGASTALPTAEQTRLTGRSRELLSEQVDAINQLLEVDLVELRRQLDQAGIPWTPGRLVAPIRREP